MLIECRLIDEWIILRRTMAEDAPLRVVTAAAIFDGHDAAIGIFRRIFQSMGCEVIHFCLLYTSPSPRDLSTSRMPSSA